MIIPSNHDLTKILTQDLENLESNTNVEETLNLLKDTFSTPKENPSLPKLRKQIVLLREYIHKLASDSDQYNALKRHFKNKVLQLKSQELHSAIVNDLTLLHELKSQASTPESEQQSSNDSVLSAASTPESSPVKQPPSEINTWVSDLSKEFEQAFLVEAATMKSFVENLIKKLTIQKADINNFKAKTFENQKKQKQILLVIHRDLKSYNAVLDSINHLTKNQKSLFPSNQETTQAVIKIRNFFKNIPIDTLEPYFPQMLRLYEKYIEKQKILVRKQLTNELLKSEEPKANSTTT